MWQRLLERLFSCRSVLKQHEIVGDLPSTKDSYRKAMRIAWPSIVETVLISLISAVDTQMVSTVGTEAVAAVGLTNQPRFIFLAVFLSFNVGVTAVIARRKGEKDAVGMNQTLKQAVVVAIILSAFLTVIAMFLSRPLMTLAGAQADTLEPSIQYFRIVMIGAFFSNISLTINAAQRGVGNTRVSMQTNLTANVVNLVGNFLLINGIWFFPKLGINGAGIATSISNVVALSLSLRSILRKDSLLPVRGPAPWKLEFRTMRSILDVASSAAAEQLFMRIGFFIYATLVAGLGTAAFATHQICMTILNLSYSVGDGLSVAATALVGQNLGAKRPDLSKLYCEVVQRIALLFSTAIFCIFLFGRHFLVDLFTDDPQIILIGGGLLTIAAFSTHMQTRQVILTGCLRGAGDTRYTALVSLFALGFLRPFTAYLFCYPFGCGVYGAWISLFIDQIIRMLLMTFRFRSGKWTLKKL